MKETTVADLVCIKRREDKKCSAALVAEVLTRDQDGILDGFLHCPACGIKYPVIQGIPIVMDSLREYLCRNRSVIYDVVGGAQALHKGLVSFMRAMRLPEPGAVNKYAFSSEERYLRTQYLEYSDNAMMRGFRSKQFLTRCQVIERWISGKDARKENAVDLGCSAGGLTEFLAQTCRFAYGVDGWYPSLFYAKMMAKELAVNAVPAVIRRAFPWETVRIKFQRSENKDFVLASLDNLPFKSGFFGMVLSSFVIDLAVESLPELDRVLRRGGNVLLSFSQNRVKWNGQMTDLAPAFIKKTLRGTRFYKRYSIIWKRGIPIYFPERYVDKFFLDEKGYCMLGSKRR